MRFVVDMNLSPEWVGYLRQRGHDAVHWSDIGAANATDAELAAWAGTNDRIVLTSDLDFGAMLALSGLSNPSVVQIRAAATLPRHVGTWVVSAFEQGESDLLAGALLTVEPGQSRLRLLPIRPQGQGR
jgi:predicted nuclease of predicted toxin-antitoxin system